MPFEKFSGPLAVDQSKFELPGNRTPDLSANDSVSKSPFAALAQSIFSGGDTGAMPGLSYMGDFDLDSFISSTLAKQRGADSGGLTQAIGGLFSKIGI